MGWSLTYSRSVSGISVLTLLYAFRKAAMNSLPEAPRSFRLGLSLAYLISVTCIVDGPVTIFYNSFLSSIPLSYLKHCPKQVQAMSQ